MVPRRPRADPDGLRRSTRCRAAGPTGARSPLKSIPFLTRRATAAIGDEGTQMELSAITFEVEDHVATITLDRPEAYNAFNDAMADDIHVVVLQANGDKAFCTGVDIKGGGTWFQRENVWNTFDPGVTLGPKLH